MGDSCGDSTQCTIQQHYSSTSTTHYTTHTQHTLNRRNALALIVFTVLQVVNSLMITYCVKLHDYAQSKLNFQLTRPLMQIFLEYSDYGTYAGIVGAAVLLIFFFLFHIIPENRKTIDTILKVVYAIVEIGLIGVVTTSVIKLEDGDWPNSYTERDWALSFEICFIVLNSLTLFAITSPLCCKKKVEESVCWKLPTRSYTI